MADGFLLTKTSPGSRVQLEPSTISIGTKRSYSEVSSIDKSSVEEALKLVVGSDGISSDDEDNLELDWLKDFLFKLLYKLSTGAITGVVTGAGILVKQIWTLIKSINKNDLEESRRSEKRIKLDTERDSGRQQKRIQALSPIYMKSNKRSDHNKGGMTQKSAEPTTLDEALHELSLQTNLNASTNQTNTQALISASDSNSPLPTNLNSYKSSQGLFTPLYLPQEKPSTNYIQHDNVMQTPVQKNKANHGRGQSNKMLFPSLLADDSENSGSAIYGTAFAFHRPVNQQKPLNSFSERLRSSFGGTYVPPKTAIPSTVAFYKDESVKLGDPQFFPMISSLFRGTKRQTQRNDDVLKQIQARKEKQRATIDLKKWNEESDLRLRNVPQPERVKMYEDIIARMQIVRKGIKELKEPKVEVEDKLVPLNDKDRVKVESYWSKGSANQILVSAFKIDVSVSDIRTLADGKWLNDNVIDFYLTLVTERCKNENFKGPKSFVFSTHFFSTMEGPKGYKGVERWAKRKNVDVTKMDYIFVPINRNNVHWCLAVINNKERKFQFYDSMGGGGAPALSLLRLYMISESERLFGNDPGMQEKYRRMYYEDFEICDRIECPQQENSYDCGVFTCKAVEVLSRGRKLIFSQKDMPMLRRLMVHAIITKQLI